MNEPPIAFSYRCPACDHIEILLLEREPVDQTRVHPCPRCDRSLSLHLTCSPQRLDLRVESPGQAPVRFAFDRTVRNQRPNAWVCQACRATHDLPADTITEGVARDLHLFCPVCLTAHALTVVCRQGECRVSRIQMEADDDD